MKLSSVLTSISIAGTLAILPAPARADEPKPPTYVRKDKFEIVPCVVKDGQPATVDNRRECTGMMDAGMEAGAADVFMFDRL